MQPSFATADLYDAHGEGLQVVEPGFRRFGGKAQMRGPVRTVQTIGDNSQVRKALGEPGEGAVLVIDGGGAMTWALLGDRLAQLGVDNGWAGVLVNGCIRDADVIATMPLGVWALATTPRKTVKREQGVRDVELRFGGVRFVPGHFLYADADGIVLSKTEL